MKLLHILFEFNNDYFINNYKSKSIKFYFCTNVIVIYFTNVIQTEFMVDRIKQIMELYELTPASFAETIGINRSNLTHLFSGRNQPSLDLAKKILHYYPDIKTEWLIMGMGNMLRNDEEKELTIKVQNEKRLQPETSEPDLFSTLSPIANVISGESPVVEKKELNEQIFDSHEVEKKGVPVIEKPIEKENKALISSLSVSKIVFFYSDNSFEVFHPNK